MEQKVLQLCSYAVMRFCVRVWQPNSQSPNHLITSIQQDPQALHLGAGAQGKNLILGG
jgi:hypothetical protein